MTFNVIAYFWTQLLLSIHFAHDNGSVEVEEGLGRIIFGVSTLLVWFPKMSHLATGRWRAMQGGRRRQLFSVPATLDQEGTRRPTYHASEAFAPQLRRPLVASEFWTPWPTVKIQNRICGQDLKVSTMNHVLVNSIFTAVKSEGVREWLIECVPNCPLTTHSPFLPIQDIIQFSVKLFLEAPQFALIATWETLTARSLKLWWVWSSAETLMTGHLQQPLFISS